MTRIHRSPSVNRNGGVEAPPARSKPRAGKDLAADRHRDRFESGPKHDKRAHHHRKHHNPLCHASGDTSPIPPDDVAMPSQIELRDTTPIPPDTNPSMVGGEPVETVTEPGNLGIRSFRTIY